MQPRFTFALAATAALALAACNVEPNEPDDRIVDTAEADPNAVDVDLPRVPVEYPEVPVNARTSVDYAGSYAQTQRDGRTQTITLRDDDTYTLRDADGTETTGTYNWYSDNSRILIRRNGQNEVYAVADGALYRLPDENASTAGRRTEEQTYRRVVGPGGPMPATGSANTGQGQDQRQQ